MNMLRINPLRDLDAWFNSYHHSAANKEANEWAPSVDIVENEENFVIKAELAGVPKEDIKVEIDSNVLTLSGERKTEVKDEKRHRIERFYGSFSRSFSLPDNIDEESIKAESKDGILSLTLPKKVQKEKLTQIEIH
ncbi:Hsp20/alpha crystallin family protein [Aliikangiella sp. IMCC44359]|uniref:Hsp20/alpha crystallin family protein n=1 Tax=Aliikangiella sp. IMCC44359 TaxID=3459125 RepID=UPI00403B06AD